MTGHFANYDEGKCRHYAAFASHLEREAFDVLYWCLFVFVIFCLFLSGYVFDKYHLHKRDGQCPVSGVCRRHCTRTLYIVIAIFLVCAVAIVMEVYALLALQFCDGEDLMSLYWSTFTVLQFGSEIAIFGVVMAVWNELGGRRSPPWALAMGTPVLVVAGVGHSVVDFVRRRNQNRLRRRSMGGTITKTDTVSSSRYAISDSVTLSNAPGVSTMTPSSPTMVAFPLPTQSRTPTIRIEEPLSQPQRSMTITPQPNNGTMVGTIDDGALIAVDADLEMGNFEQWPNFIGYAPGSGRALFYMGNGLPRRGEQDFEKGRQDSNATLLNPTNSDKDFQKDSSEKDLEKGLSEPGSSRNKCDVTSLFSLAECGANSLV